MFQKPVFPLCNQKLHFVFNWCLSDWWKFKILWGWCHKVEDYLFELRSIFVVFLFKITKFWKKNYILRPQMDKTWMTTLFGY